MTSSKTGAALAFLLGYSSALQYNAPESPQSLTDTICNGRPRTQCEVELDVPQSCVATGSEADPGCPIVFFLHGSGGTNNFFARTSGVHDAGYIGVYPQGEGGWNTGPKSTNNCSWDDFGCTEDPDEGDFIASIIAEIQSQGASGNIYAIGNSNGAALAYRLASNAGPSLPIKGIVAKVTQLLASPERSGPGELNYNQPQAGSPAVSVLSIMGTDDSLIPYEGGSSAVFGGDDFFQLMPTLDSMSTWAVHNECDGTLVIDDSYTTDQGTGQATKYDYTGGCPSGIILEHYAIHGGGHGAGGASINGEKIDYVIAYDFIERVEDGAGDVSPVTPSAPSPPVASPVASPTASPTAADCSDDPTWHGKFNAAHTCDYVSESPAQRCGWENTEGVLATDACLETCGSCSSPVAAPVAAPVESPVSPVASPTASPTAADCSDDPTWHGKFNAAHTCDYVSENPNQRCGWENTEGVRAADACLETCGSCSSPVAAPVAPPVESPVSPVASPTASPTAADCSDDPTWHGKFNAAHTCDYVSENPNQRCGWENTEGVRAADACLETCGTCSSRRNRYLRRR